MLPLKIVKNLKNYDRKILIKYIFFKEMLKGMHLKIKKLKKIKVDTF